MGNNGTFKTSVSFPIELWNDIQEVISNDEQSFSRFLQSSSRLKLKHIKMQNVRDFLETLNQDEIESLKIEIKKRG